MKTIEKIWLEYRKKAIPPNAGDTQLTETKRAFYAGSLGLLKAIMCRLEDGLEPTKKDLDFMDSIADELNNFFGEVKRGVA